MDARRFAIRGLLSGLALLGVMPATARADGADNPIARENALPGTQAWDIHAHSHFTVDDAIGQIKGYASATSVTHGEMLTLHVSVDPAQSYGVDIYRIGWYGGAGGRLMQHLTLSGSKQPDCPVAAGTGLIECHWAPSAQLTIPSSWTTGIYLALLRNAAGYENYIVFVVRDDTRPAPLRYQMTVNTMQAYNNYPADGVHGKSLYDYNSNPPNTVAGSTRAVQVSFDRPYFGDGDGRFLGPELSFVRWLERSGYDVSYTTDVDTHEQGAQLREHRALVTAGHDEYWTKEMRDAVEAARDAGVNLGFFSANTVYWQVRMVPSSDGRPDRIIVAYKDLALDPGQGARTTIRWRDPPVSRPEQTLVGIEYGTPANPNAAMRIINSGNWVYEGSGFTDGATVPGIVGDEADWLNPALPGPLAVSYVTLSSSPVPGQHPAESSIYQAPSGAWVFAGGTISYGLGLDGPLADARLQRMTANVLNRFASSSAAQPPIPGRWAPVAAARRTSSVSFRLTARWSVRGSRTSIRKLLVTRLLSRGAVEFRCAGKDCPVRRKKGAKPRRGRVDLLKAIGKRRFRAGQTLEVRITAPDRIGRVVRYRLRKGKDPKERRLCLRPGARSPGVC